MNDNSLSKRISRLSPVCVLRMLLWHLWMIAAAAAIFGMSASMYLQWLYQPVYQAKMTYSVTARETSYIANRNVTVSTEVATVLTELIGTNVVMQNIRDYSPELADFNGSVSARHVTGSNLIVVSTTAGAPKDAFRALQALEKVLPELSDLISSKSVIQVIQNPSVSAHPINSVNSRRTVMLCGAAGAGLMVLLLCWLCLEAETIQTRRGAKDLLDASVITVVNHERKYRTLKSMIKRAKKGLHVFDPGTSAAYAQQINAICAKLEHDASARGSKIFLVTGVGENEGKSTIAGNVAAMLAMKGCKTALVDCDLRKPALFRFFHDAYKSPLPLNKLLEQPYSRANFLKCMVCHPRLGLYMLFSSRSMVSPAKLLASDTMVSVLQQLRVFDYVIIDSPPMGFFADAVALADMADASLLVVRQDYTPSCDLNDAVDTLKNAKSTFLGCVLNDMIEFDPGHYGYGYGYGYGAAGSSHSKRSQR